MLENYTTKFQNLKKSANELNRKYLDKKRMHTNTRKINFENNDKQNKHTNR